MYSGLARGSSPASVGVHCRRASTLAWSSRTSASRCCVSAGAEERGGERGFEEGPLLLQQSPDATAELKVVTPRLEGSGHDVGEASARGEGAGGGASTAPWLNSCHCVVARERHCR